MKARREAGFALRIERGIPFPNDFRRDRTSDQLHAEFDAKEAEEQALNIEVSWARAARAVLWGKASFVTLQDVGGRIQLYVARDDHRKAFTTKQFKSGIAAISSAARKVSCSKPKPASCLSHCTELRLLTRCVRCRINSTACRTERAYRQHVWISSLTMNRGTAEARSKITAGIRQFMVCCGFMEVEKRR